MEEHTINILIEYMGALQILEEQNDDHPLYQEKSPYWHNSGAVLTIAQLT